MQMGEEQGVDRAKRHLFPPQADGNAAPSVKQQPLAIYLDQGGRAEAAGDRRRRAGAEQGHLEVRAGGLGLGEHFVGGSGQPGENQSG